MKKRILFFVCAITVVWCVSAAGYAQPAEIKNIFVDSEDNVLKISIVSNQPLPIETFTGTEDSRNYIILDFLGTVYTALPQVINVNRGIVEKMSLIMGDDKTGAAPGGNYYAVDFISVNLTALADYRVTQSRSVIDVDIVDAGKSGLPASGRTVELSPPIVVTRDDVDSEEKPAQKKTKKRRGFLFFRRSVPKTEEPRGEEAPESGDRVRRQAAAAAEPAPVLSEPAVKEKETNLDLLVQDVIRERERADKRIENLQMQLQKMQSELNLSKDEKSEVESKIREILAKLDELKNALDAEIARKLALGEKVEDLTARREHYVRAKARYEDLLPKFDGINAQVNKLTLSGTEIQGEIELLQREQKELETKIESINKEREKIRADHERAAFKQDVLGEEIAHLSRQIDELTGMLEQSTREREKVIAELRGADEKSRLSDEEILRLRGLLARNNAQIQELTLSFAQVKERLDAAIAEKLIIDSAYYEAEREYQRIKKEITALLEK